MTSDSAIDAAIERAIQIARRVASQEDVRARDLITGFDGELDFSDLESLAIEESAWRRIADAAIPPRLVFAHPALLQAVPSVSLHYRGIAMLSRKIVANLAGNVDRWEDPNAKPRVTPERALKVCRLYNAVISSLILDKTDWTMENGYRNVLATIGITADGTMRNIIGQSGEREIKRRMLAWVREQGLLADDSEEPSDAALAGAWMLSGGVRMVFSSEPDIGFERNGAWAAVIEVKAGKDPAGALERLGAIKKTFDQTPASCKRFLIAGVVTPSMRSELDGMHVEQVAMMHDLLYDDAKWLAYMNDVFHHALRIADQVSP